MTPCLLKGLFRLEDVRLSAVNRRGLGVSSSTAVSVMYRIQLVQCLIVAAVTFSSIAQADRLLSSSAVQHHEHFRTLPPVSAPESGLTWHARPHNTATLKLGPATSRPEQEQAYQSEARSINCRPISAGRVAAASVSKALQSAAAPQRQEE